MKNDFQLLPLGNLYNTFLERCRQAHSQALAIAQQKAEHRYRQLVQASQGEAGPEGIEEALVEQNFDPQLVKLGPAQLNKIMETEAQLAAQEWAELNAVSQKLTWLPHQMMAYFAQWTPVKGPGGLWSPALTKKHNTQCQDGGRNGGKGGGRNGNRDLFSLGSLLLARANRSIFFKDAPRGTKQYASPINPFVPIVLASFKKFHNIPYMQWDLSEIAALENSELASLVNYTIPELTAAELLKLRNTALTPRTGARAGIPSNPETCTFLYHLDGTEIAHLPKLAKYMALQTWCCHPSNRTKYMILDPQDWDRMPDPIIVGGDIFIPQPKFTVQPQTNYDHDSLPWDA